jgi:hypothetical protein
MVSWIGQPPPQVPQHKGSGGVQGSKGESGGVSGI